MRREAARRLTSLSCVVCRCLSHKHEKLCVVDGAVCAVVMGGCVSFAEAAALYGNGTYPRLCDGPCAFSSLIYRACLSKQVFPFLYSLPPGMGDGQAGSTQPGPTPDDVSSTWATQWKKVCLFSMVTGGCHSLPVLEPSAV